MVSGFGFGGIRVITALPTCRCATHRFLFITTTGGQRDCAYGASLKLGVISLTLRGGTNVVHWQNGIYIIYGCCRL